MKVHKHETGVKPFAPISAVFVFETQGELDAMAALFTHIDVDAALSKASGNGGMGSAISDGLESIGSNYKDKFEIIVGCLKSS